jgi:hydrogenase maturation protease
MRLLVVGLGNILLQDEGAGVHLVKGLAERFELPSEVEVLDGGTSGMELIHTIANRDALIVCDAVRSDRPPGTVMRIKGEELPAFYPARLSPHQLGLSDMLATLTLLGQVPPTVTLIGIVPRDLELGTELSPPIGASLEDALALLVAEIGSMGILLHPRPVSATGFQGGAGPTTFQVT